MDREERVTSILWLLAKSKTPCRVTDISRQLKIGKSSVSRVLASLERLGWVTQSADGQYSTGNLALDMSLAVLSNVNLRTVGFKSLIQLNEATGETVGLVLKQGLEHICVDQKEGTNLVRHVMTLGLRQPLWIGATGKCILAHVPDEEAEKVFSSLEKSGNVVSASGQLITRSSLKSEIVDIRKVGYSISLGEITPITSAIAAPIFERNRIIGSILITGPMPRFSRKVAESYGDMLKDMAKDISRQLGSN